jgi:WD40 repeat protein
MALRLSANGEVLATVGKGGLALWSAVTGARLSLQEKAVRPDSDGREIALSPDGRWVAAVLPGDEMKAPVVVWDTVTGKEKHRNPAPPRTCAVDFSADGKVLLTGARNGLFDERPDNAVRFWGLALGKEVRQLDIGADLRTQRWRSGTTVRALIQSPDRKLLVVLADVIEIDYGPPGAPGGPRQPYSHEQIRVFELVSGKELLRAEVDHGTAVGFSPDGRRLAWGRYCGVSLWDRDTGKLSWSESHGGLVSAVQFSPDSGSLVTGSADGTVLLWDLARLRRREHPDVEQERRMRPAAR